MDSGERKRWALKREPTFLDAALAMDCMYGFQSIVGVNVNPSKRKLVSSCNSVLLIFTGTKRGSLWRLEIGVCRKGVGSNSIYCAGCSHWVHKKCSGVTGSIKSNPDHRCSRCKGTARPIDGRPHNEWLLMQDKKLDVVDSFCYLGDTIGAGRWLRFECYYKNSICMGQVPGTLANINLTCPFIHHMWASIQHVYPHCLVVCQ